MSLSYGAHSKIFFRVLPMRRRARNSFTKRRHRETRSTYTGSLLPSNGQWCQLV